jgi:hypothetical protein
MQILYVTNPTGWGGNITLLPGYTMVILDPTEQEIASDFVEGLLDMFGDERNKFYYELEAIYDMLRKKSKGEIQ